MAFNRTFNAAKGRATRAATAFEHAHGRVEAFGTGEVPKELLTDLKNASRELKASSVALKSARGELVPSIQHLFVRMGETVGIKNVFTKATPELAESVREIALLKRTGIIERTLSKPARIAGKYAGVAVIAAGVATVLGIASHQRKKAEEQTQQDLMARSVDAQMAVANAQASANATYQLSPEEYAYMMSQMRGGNGGPSGGHAAALMEARQQAAAAAAGTPAGPLA